MVAASKSLISYDTLVHAISGATVSKVNIVATEGLLNFKFLFFNFSG